MSLRTFLDKLEKEGLLERIDREVDPYLEITRILKEKDGKTVLFENVKGTDYKVAGGVCGSRKNFELAFGCGPGKALLEKVGHAIDAPSRPEKTNDAPCQEFVEKEADLEKIPILTHGTQELGAYITAGVYVVSDPEYGQNLSFHRTCRIGKDKLVARICQRDLYKYMERSKGDLEVAICLGLDPAVLLAAGVSAKTGLDEMTIANSLTPQKVAKCKTKNLYVPAEAEIVLEGRITKNRAPEGPFIDITGTVDYVRQEPVIEIDCITHRKNPIYHGLVSSLSEHRFLMGMPREPVIYREVSKECKCLDVALTPGGCSWLHAAVSIEKKNPDDGMKAIDAAFRGHASLKHVVVVDSDIDVHDTEAVEWSVATRSQAGKNMKVIKEKGSSLDPSAEDDRTTFKAGIDATVPAGRKREKFLKGKLGE